jgi:hypothetical protein
MDTQQADAIDDEADDKHHDGEDRDQQGDAVDAGMLRYVGK